MRRTSTIIAGAIVLILGVGLLMLYSTRVVVLRKTGGEGLRSRQVVSRELPLSDFARVRVRGPVEVSIDQGERFGVVLQGPSAADALGADTADGTLTVAVEAGRRYGRGALKAFLVMPSLADLTLEQAADVRVRGFVADSVGIAVVSRSSLTGVSNTWGTAALRVDSAVVALAESRLVNARLEANGPSKVEVTMVGGALAGHVGGGARVRCHGRCSSNSLVADRGAHVQCH